MATNKQKATRAKFSAKGGILVLSPPDLADVVRRPGVRGAVSALTPVLASRAWSGNREAGCGSFLEMEVIATAPPRGALVRVPIRTGIVVAVVLALVVVEATSRSGVLWRLVTFTYQANVLAAAYYVWALTSPRAERSAGLRGAIVVYVVVAGLIWNLLLTDRSMGYTPANILLHVVVPVLALTDWLLVGQSQHRLRWWQPMVWLAYPAAYLLLALLLLNEIGRRAPYYFLDPDSVGAAAVVANVGLFAAGFLALGYLLAAAGRLSGSWTTSRMTPG